MASDIIRKHLLAARQELLAQRALLEFELAELERMIDSTSASRASARAEQTPAGATTKDVEVVVVTPDGQSHPVDVTVNPGGLRGRIADYAKLVGSGESIEEAVVGILDFAKAPLTTEDIIASLMITNGEWRPTSIRSQLSRSAADGRIQRVRRGVYQAVAHTNNSAPAATGAEPESLLTLEGGDRRDETEEDHGDDQA